MYAKDDDSLPKDHPKRTFMNRYNGYLNSSIIKNLIKKCKEELDQYSCSTIPNFILPKSLKVMYSEL